MDCYVPGYYGRFKCIADKCRHSCCVGWAVCIDGGTRERYECLGGELGDSLRSALCDDGDGAYLKMREGRCPMLDSSGLCRIISELGEGELSHICARHPRFISLLGKRCEVGLGISCEEAARIVLLDGGPFSLVRCDGALLRWGEIPDVDIPYGADISRETLALADSEGSLDGALCRLSEQYGARFDFHTDGEWLSLLYDLEYLDGEWHRLLARERGERIDFEYRERILKNLLLYFIYRHTPEASGREDFTARLSFATLSAHICDILFDIAGVASADAALDICRAFSEEIEYSEDNLAELMLEFECFLPR